MNSNNKFSASNPERIRYWILGNIHMVWEAVKKLQQPELKGNLLRVTFYKGSWPIVCHWHILSAKEINQISDTFISEELWYIDGGFSTINAFADWVKNVKIPLKELLEESDNINNSN